MPQLTDEERKIRAMGVVNYGSDIIAKAWKPKAVRPELSSPAKFAAYVSNGRFSIPPHIALLDSALVDVAEGRTKRLLVNMPPRHGKSYLVSHHFPAWFVGKYPQKRVILATYEAEFAASWGRKARDLISEHGDLFGVRLRGDSTAAHAWNLAGTEGGMDTAGAGGAITGKGAHLLVVDDPIKNSEEAASETIRKKIWDWFLSTVYTRLEPDAGLIVVMTPWHEDDPSGRIRELARETGEAWRFISLPAIAEEEDTLGRAVGEPLWPERYPLEELESIRRTIGSYYWNALYQGRPQPEGGALFKRSWFKYFRVADAYYLLSNGSTDRRVKKDDCWRFQTVDAAGTTNATSDSTVISTWAVTPRYDLLLLCVQQEKLETTSQKDAMINAYRRWGPVVQGIELITFGLNLFNDCKAQGLPVIALKPDKDKVSRARVVAARYEVGAVYHALGEPWLDDYERELLSFPTGKHDDMVDTAAYAGIYIADQGLSHVESEEEREQRLSDEMRYPDDIPYDEPPATRAGRYY